MNTRTSARSFPRASVVHDGILNENRDKNSQARIGGDALLYTTVSVTTSGVEPGNVRSH